LIYKNLKFKNGRNLTGVGMGWGGVGWQKKKEKEVKRRINKNITNSISCCKGQNCRIAILTVVKETSCKWEKTLMHAKRRNQ
jgi:hypothetical protein